MRVRIGFSMIYESAYPTPMLLAVRPRHCLIEEQRTLTPDVPVREYIDGFNNHIWRLVAPVGTLQITYDVVADVSPTSHPVLPDLPKTIVDYLPDEVIVY